MSGAYPPQGVMSTYQLTAHTHSGIGQGGLVDPSVINHDALLNSFVDEHLALPNIIVNVLTDHNKIDHDALGIDADTVDGVGLPNTIANILTDHNKAVHDALGIDADTVDTYHHDQSLLQASSPIFVTAKLSALTDGYIPYHVSDVAGLANSPIFTNGTKVGIGIAVPLARLDIAGGTQDANNSSLKLTSAIYPWIDLYSADVNVNNRNWRIAGIQTDYGIFEILNSLAQGGVPNESRFTINKDGHVVIVTGNLSLLSATSIITGGTTLNIEAGVEGIRSSTIYNDESVSPTNLRITPVDLQIVRSTAGNRKYKDKIKDLELDTSLLYNLRPISFTSKCKVDDKKKRFHGLIADEVEQIYLDVVEYNKENEPDEVDYRAIQMVMLKEIQNLNGRLSTLEN